MNIELIKQEVCNEWNRENPEIEPLDLAKEIAELEYQRWWLHQKWVQMSNPVLKKLYSQRAYWKEVGAFVCTLSRQQGKTTLIKRIVKEVGGIIITPYNAMKDTFKEGDMPLFTEVWSCNETKRQLVGFDTSDRHLFIDEFYMLENFIDGREIIESFLSKEWKSVSLFGTLA